MTDAFGTAARLAAGRLPAYLAGVAEATDENWRRPGRCNSCVHFRQDFGTPPEVYGHCKVYPRPGQRAGDDAACPQYQPMEGFDELTRSRDPLAPQNLDRHGPRSSRPVRRAPPSRSAPSGPKAAVRGPDADARLEEAVASLTGDGDATMDRAQLRDVLLGVIEEFIGLEEVELGDRWEGGRMILEPGREDTKSHEVPLETFFHKLVLLRERLRVLEQKINANDKLDDADKVELQQYVSRIYGSLTTFNVLFKHKEDRFSSK